MGFGAVSWRKSTAIVYLNVSRPVALAKQEVVSWMKTILGRDIGHLQLRLLCQNY